MPTRILGLSAYFHDSAAALVVDGRVVAAAQEERFTRVKHDARFPERAIAYCLAQAGIGPGELDYVAYHEKPLLKFGRLLETYLAFAPAGFGSFVRAMPLWLGTKLHIPGEIRRALGGWSGPLVFVEHHESHAASAFFPSPFSEAAILTLDGVGEWATASLGTGRGHRIELTHELRFPHSLGLVYSAFTAYAGFRVNSGEYKLMGLAPYGEPRYAGLILSHLIDLKPDGSLRLDLDYFNYCQGLTMTAERFHRLFGHPPRRPDEPITTFHADVAASIQSVTEEVMLRMGRDLFTRTGVRNVVLAGGVALNCVGNGRLLREGPYERMWIQPAAGDAGGALGSALFTWHQLLGAGRDPAGARDGQQGSFLGPEFDDAHVAGVLDAAGVRYHRLADDDALCDRVAELLAAGQVVGWFQGRMEFGPRALGARSILGDARDPGMQSRMNLKIKVREGFRPFAPSVLAEHAADWFEIGRDQDSAYMLLVAPVHASQRVPLPPEAAALTGLDRIKAIRSRIPAATHVDGSARIHTVDEARNRLYHCLLERFLKRTGCPVLVNTSFNVRGEPIVCTPQEALRCFAATGIDALAIGRHLLVKSEQPPPAPGQVAAYVEAFSPD
jgi:carbamoyltransferase